MAQFEILSEHEFPGGWRFEVQVLDAQGTLRRHQATLSWADYNHWSLDGGDTPQQVFEAALTFFLHHLPADQLPDRFDASQARRRFPHAADDDIRRMIRK